MYKLTDETKEFFGTKLHRVQYEDGSLGGWIESEKNLSQDGNARVYDDARVYGDAQVSGNAWVYDDARVYGDAQVAGNARVGGAARVCGDALVCSNARVGGDAQVYGDAQVSGDALVYGAARVCGDALVEKHSDWMVIGPIGSRDGFTTIYRTGTGLSVVCGCFEGTLEEFSAAVDNTHGDNKHARDYKAMIEMVKARMLQE